MITPALSLLAHWFLFKRHFGWTQIYKEAIQAFVVGHLEDIKSSGRQTPLKKRIDQFSVPFPNLLVPIHLPSFTFSWSRLNDKYQWTSIIVAQTLASFLPALRNKYVLETLPGGKGCFWKGSFNLFPLYENISLILFIVLKSSLDLNRKGRHVWCSYFCTFWFLIYEEKITAHTVYVFPV